MIGGTSRSRERRKNAAAGAHGVTIDSQGRFAYVTNTFDDSGSVIDIARRKVTATVKVGNGPNGITFLPRS